MPFAFDGIAMAVVMVALIVVRVPIAFALIGSVAIYLVFNPGLPMIVLAQKVSGSLDSFVLGAVPLFILLGTAMDRTNAAAVLVRFARAIIGWVPGGLAQANVVDSVFFSGISGSAMADTVATGGVVIPAMKRAGYSGGFAAALTAASSLVGPVIPPSIHMVVYASLADVSVGRLFLGGVFPGLVMSGVMMAYIVYLTIRTGLPRDPFPSVRTLLVATRDAAPVLVLPAIIVLGVVGGIFTATESAAVGAAYALVMGLLYNRGLRLSQYWEMFVISAVMTGAVMLLVAGASAFGYILTVEQLPQTLAQHISEVASSPLQVIFWVGVLLFAVGFVLNLEACIVLLTPVLAPLAVATEIDLVHLGVFMVVTLAIGQLTPPVALTLLAAARIGNVDPHDAFRHAVPFVLVLIVAAAIVGAFPEVTLWLPNRVMN